MSEIDSREITTINQKPIPGFTITPSPAYIDSLVKIVSTATDMDGYIDKHQYSITPPNGSPAAFTQQSNFDRVYGTIGKWQIRQVVTDNDGATAEMTKTLDVVNRAPQAEITMPTGATSATATPFNTATPRIMWKMTDEDAHTQQRFRLLVKKESGSLIYDSGAIHTSRSHLDLPASAWLQENIKYKAEVQVFDGYDWSPYSAPKYFYILLNRPPVGDFTWLPQPLYEGDTATFRSQVSDEDFDELDVSYVLTSPSGKKLTFSYTFRNPYPTTGPMHRMTEVGAWNMQLTVSDRKADLVTIVKKVQVLPLSLTAAVSHTEKWNERRQSYNLEQSGNKESPRGSLTFWAGEKFMLHAQTTKTGTATKADKVEVKMKTYRLDLAAEAGNPNDWSGELWEETFEQLPDGTLTFLFTAYYNNGTVKETEVNVQVQGNVNGLIGVHRVH